MNLRALCLLLAVVAVLLVSCDTATTPSIGTATAALPRATMSAPVGTVMPSTPAAAVPTVAEVSAFAATQWPQVESCRGPKPFSETSGEGYTTENAGGYVYAMVQGKTATITESLSLDITIVDDDLHASPGTVAVYVCGLPGKLYTTRVLAVAIQLIQSGMVSRVDIPGQPPLMSAAAAQSAGPPEHFHRYTISSDNVTFRLTPKISTTNVEGTLAQGEVVFELLTPPQSADGYTWHYVRLSKNGQEGWVAEQFLSDQ